jgi:hypothetical protein
VLIAAQSKRRNTAGMEDTTTTNAKSSANVTEAGAVDLTGTELDQASGGWSWGEGEAAASR